MGSVSTRLTLKTARLWAGHHYHANDLPPEPRTCAVVPRRPSPYLSTAQPTAVSTPTGSSYLPANQPPGLEGWRCLAPRA